MPFDVDSVRGGRRIQWVRSVGSTMTLAADLARQGCASGTVVGADEQVAGVGRHGHSWHSEPDAGLYVSIVLRLPVAANDMPLVMLALGLAAQEAIVNVSGLAADLRWPNDVLLNGKKCAGILAQLEGEAIIAGIGINVGHTSFPKEIRDLATSLRIEGASVRREDLLSALLASIDEHVKILIDDGPDAILRLFARASSYAEGRRVCVEKDGATIMGTTCGLDNSGFLVVREDNGRETTILAGGVRPV
jgi:BirA family transcriptional regulator, biotin operon repressor / biotin---[acetyl-CoA-carboxylase] ligase